MIEPTNAELLQSQQSLQKLVERDFKGVYTLRLEEIVSEVNLRLQKLQSVEEDLSRRVRQEDLSQDEADEQWQEVLKETLDINQQPLPDDAFRTVKLSLNDLQALKWMRKNEQESDGEEE